MPDELKHDQRREAVPSICGFVYQFWQSIYRWITLKENEILFLEGAEDIDILSPENGAATTIQIKYSKRSISLNSKDVIEAINNYWKHRAGNADKEIEYYFITTSQRGKEKGNPFGDMSGLEYWERCANPINEIAPLKDYLLKNENLSVEVKQYINIATDNAIRYELIKRIKWLTGSRDLKSIQELVERKLCLYGNERKIPYQLSLKVVPILLKQVTDVICQKSDRRLEYFDFIKLFDDSTVVSVPFPAFGTSNQMLALKAMTLQISPIGSPDSGPDIQLGKSYVHVRTILPDKCIKRTDLINNLLKILENQWILIIKGSSGTGKSVLTRLLTNAEKSKWLWIDAKSLNSIELKELLFRIALDNKGINRRIVINDIELSPVTEEYYSALEALLYNVYSSEGKIILTTQGDLPVNIYLNIRITSESIVDIPLLKSEEIEQLATEYGCVDTKQLDIWTKVISARTHGHPQLAHAWIKNLSLKKWPKFQIDDLLKEEDIEVVRREARTKLFDQLPSDAARGLVYGLSVVGSPFRRDHAIELGQRIQGLSNPGEIFDHLIGPWVEKLGNNYYRISPLLENSAYKVWAKDKIIAIQKEIAETYVNCGSLSLLEANVILTNGIISKAREPVLGVVTSLLRAPEKYRGKISDGLDWITAIGLDPGMKAFPSDPFVNIFMRQLQYEVAIGKNDIELASKIADRWEQELEYGQIPELKAINRFMFLLKTIIYHEVRFSLKVVVSRIAEAINLSLLNKELSINKYPIDGLFLFALIRCKTRKDLGELLITLEKYPIEIRNSLAAMMKSNIDSAEVLLNQVFLGELNSKSPDWESCIKEIEDAIEIAFSWKIESLAIAAYRTIAIIFDEQLKNSEKGLGVLDTAKDRLGYEHPFLLNERATILYNQKRYREALDIWEDVFYRWPVRTVFDPIYHFPFALNCAAIEAEWNKIIKLSKRGIELANQKGNRILATAFLSEQAFALWKGRNYQESINGFAEILDELPHLPDPNKNIHSYKLQKLIGHTLAWMTQEVGDSIELTEPQMGCFINQNIDEKIREYPLHPMGFMWYFLANLEYKVGTGKSLLKRLEKESYILNIPFLSYQVEHINIGHSLRNLDFDSLVSDYCNCYFRLKIFRQHSASGASPIEKANATEITRDNQKILGDPEMLFLLILGALIKLTNNGKYPDAPLEKWAIDVKLHQIVGFDNYFQFIKDAPQKCTEELNQLMIEGKTEIRSVAALNVSSRELIKPVYRLYAEFSIVHVMKAFPWIEAVEVDIEQMISRNWERVISKQSFALLAPRANIPIIVRACSAPSKGLKKAARILVAAKNTVQLLIPDVEFKQLKDLADNE